jgi:hypothetical protein
MGKGGVVVGLDHTDWGGEGGQYIPDEGLEGLDGHLLAELDDAQPRAAVDGGILAEPSALD